ncbi:MAG: GspMb/PilO family protein [Pseudomonadota bacterium]
MSEFRFARPTRPPLAFAAFLAVAALGLGALGQELLGGVATLERDIADKRALIQRAAMTVDAGPAIAVYEAATAEEARARFQTDIQAIADAHGLAVETLGTADMVITDGLVRMALTVNGSLPENALGALLVALEAARPAILLDGISLRRARGRQAANAARLLPIRIEIAAYADV